MPPPDRRYLGGCPWNTPPRILEREEAARGRRELCFPSVFRPAHAVCSHLGRTRPGVTEKRIVIQGLPKSRGADSYRIQGDRPRSSWLGPVRSRNPAVRAGTE